MFHSEEYGCRPAGDADLVINVLKVMRHSLFTDDKLLSDLAVAGPRCQQPLHLDFTVGETGGPCAPARRFRCSDP
jgi:hypothetical protein